jgi:hypothetical protein
VLVIQNLMGQVYAFGEKSDFDPARFELQPGCNRSVAG